MAVFFSYPSIGIVVRKVDVTVFDGTNQIWEGTAPTPLEFGRQQEGDSGPLELHHFGNEHRLVIAPLEERAVPRQAFRIDCSAAGELLVTNIHTRLSFPTGQEGRLMGPGESIKAKNEIVVRLPENRIVRVVVSAPDSQTAPSSDADTHFRTLSGQPVPSSGNSDAACLKDLFKVDDRKDQGQVAVDLVRAALNVVQKAAGSNEFFDATVSAVATMIELDRALVLLREGNQWVIRSSYIAGQLGTDSDTDGDGITPPTMNFSRGLTERVLRTGKTVIYDPANYMHTADSSMMVLDRAVAAPIFDEKHNVIGAIYGDRRFGSSAGDTPIGDLEAALLEVMAGAVSSGIARQRQEAIRSSLTQFFSHAIAERLEKNEDLLAGRDAEVSVMFCDIRGFSTVSERVGPKKTIEWINDVLTELSQCVTNTDGVLVDYIGDELMAMWGAPAEMPDHAARACRSAVEMLKLIEPLRQRWKDITPDKFSFGIGINTGIARVGNTGSRVKFKYGPLGNTVNVASRVEGITKKLGVGALITDSTARSIGSGFNCRRMANVQVVGIHEPVTIHELKGDADQNWRSMSARYELALNQFDSGDLTGAARTLASLVHAHPEDNPSLVLLGRVVDALNHRDEHVDSVWKLTSK